MISVIEKMKKYFLVSVLLAMLIGVLGGLFFGMNYHKKNTIKENTLVETRQGGYRYINPLLECDYAQNSNLLSNQGITSLELKIRKIIDDRNLSDAAVYYRDLNNGPWFGINYEEEFNPASLSKVPILITYFKVAESNPTILEKKIKYTHRNSPNNQNIISKHIVIGESYTVLELLEYMIKYSDNEAAELLYLDIDKGFLRETYYNLGLAWDSNTLENTFTVKEYASFFRVLYNASYLNRSMSEKALELLSQTDFNDGLVRKIPEKIMMAHKFGERKFIYANGVEINQLHDCGIIYLPKNPYLLCVMTRDSDFKKLPLLIQDISSQIYEKLATEE